MRLIGLLKWALGLLLVAVGNLQGACVGPSIEGNLKYKPHELVSLKAVGVDPKAALLWRVYPVTGVYRAKTSKELFQASVAPGSYDVMLIVLSNGPDGLQADEVWVKIEVEGCQPVPPRPEKPTPPSPGKVDAALGRLSFNGAGCTATPIYPVRADGRYDILSAAHCVPGMGARGTWTCQDGRSFQVVVTVFNKAADICWLRTVNVPEKPLPVAVLARELPSKGAKVWQAGYGVQVPRNREEGQFLASEGADGKLQFWLSVSSGDSGGPIVHDETDTILAPVCCTTNKGARAFVWGGSCRVAWKMREQLADDAGQEAWQPLDIPEIQETEEHRAALAGLAAVALVGLAGRRRDDLGDDLADDLAELRDDDLEQVSAGKQQRRPYFPPGSAGELRIQFFPSPKIGGKLGLSRAR